MQIQAVEGDSLAERAYAQQREVIPLEPSRGTIYDRSGQPLAVDQPAKTLIAYPHQVRNPMTTAAFIAQQLHPGKRKHARGERRREAERVLALLATPDAVQVTLARQLDPRVAQRILDGRLPGIASVAEQRRTYPARDLAAQVLGYTDIDGRGRPHGAGLELELDPYLAGKPGREVILRDSAGLPLSAVSLQKPLPGRDVTLTIDRAIQAEVQRILGDTVERWAAKSATAIVLDPRTGEVLAMATAPTYDNNRAHSVRDLFERQTNRAVQDVYEPGSTFKVVTMSAALSNGTVFPEMEFNNLPPELRVADRVIHDDEARGPIDLTASQILSHSSNVGTVTIAQMVGRDELSRWIDRYGFGKRTALRFPGEDDGIVLAPGDWSGSSIGNIPIGQGIGVTAIQMAQMYAAIANGGVMVEPHLVAGVEGVRLDRPARRRILDADVDRQLVDMLKNVVSDEGTGVLATIPGYTVAGKTGTAEKAVRGGYSETDFVASFVGFFPADAPQVEIMVVVDTPRGNIFGGAVAAPAFAEIGRYVARALGVRPDRPRELALAG